MFLSDRAGLCELVTGRSIPKNAALLMIVFKHNASDNRNSPFEPGTYAVRTSGSRADQDVKRATFVNLNDECQNMLAQEATRATSGEVVLDAVASRPGGSASGHMELVFGSAGKLAGSFTASFCAFSGDLLEPNNCK